MTSRRGFLLGIGAALAAPAIVRAEVLMPVRKLLPLVLNEPGLIDHIDRLIMDRMWVRLHPEIEPFIRGRMAV